MRPARQELRPRAESPRRTARGSPHRSRHSLPDRGLRPDHHDGSAHRARRPRVAQRSPRPAHPAGRHRGHRGPGHRGDGRPVRPGRRAHRVAGARQGHRARSCPRRPPAFRRLRPGARRSRASPDVDHPWSPGGTGHSGPGAYDRTRAWSTAVEAPSSVAWAAHPLLHGTNAPVGQADAAQTARSARPTQPTQPSRPSLRQTRRTLRRETDPGPASADRRRRRRRSSGVRPVPRAQARYRAARPGPRTRRRRGRSRTAHSPGG